MLTCNALMESNAGTLSKVEEKLERIPNEEIHFYVVESVFKTMQNPLEGFYTEFTQFKILHSRIAINDKSKGDQIFPFCKDNPGSIIHAVLIWQYGINLFK